MYIFSTTETHIKITRHIYLINISVENKKFFTIIESLSSFYSIDLWKQLKYILIK